VGKQFTLRESQSLDFLWPVLEPPKTFTPPPELVLRGVKDGLNRGWQYVARNDFGPGGYFQSDRNHERPALDDLLALATPDTPMKFTVVPPGTGRRIGIDRDEDGLFDRTELDTGFDPADPLSHPPLPPVLTIVHEPDLGRITLRWPDTGIFTVFSTTNLTPPVPWSMFPGIPVLDGSEWSLSIPTPTGLRFFRLQIP
jgi:hypothetical protein